MIRLTLIVALWLAAGAGLLAALYWLFLNTPESNVLMLIASALLTLLMIAGGAVVAGSAVLLALGGTLTASVAVALRRLWWPVAVAVPAALSLWLVLQVDAWVAQRAGEISAWLIARFGWADTTPLFTAERYVSTWLRWVAIPVAAVAGLAVLLGGTGERARRWIRSAIHWRTLLVATLAFAILVVLPWQAASWRIGSLPPTWVEPVAASVRLALVAALIALGYAVIVVAAARRAAQDTSHVEP